MDCSMPGFPVLHYLLEFAQSHVHSVSNAIQPSHPLLAFSHIVRVYLLFEKRKDLFNCIRSYCGMQDLLLQHMNSSCGAWEERWRGIAQRIFRTVKLFCMTLLCGIHVTKHLSKLTECITPRVTLIQTGLWVITTRHCMFTNCSNVPLW